MEPVAIEKALEMFCLPKPPKGFKVRTFSWKEHGPEVEQFVANYFADNKANFRGLPGPRGADGGSGPQGPQGPQGNPGRPPTQGEIAFAVETYILEQRGHGFLARARQVAVPALALAALALAVAIAALFLPVSPSAQERIAELRGDPAFMAAVTGPTGPAGIQGIPGKDADPAQVATVLMANPSFVTSVKGKDGAPGLQGPVGPAGIQGPPGKDVGLERLATCKSEWFPHVGRTAGFYYKCPDGFEFTVPMGGSLTLEEAHIRLQGKYP